MNKTLVPVAVALVSIGLSVGFVSAEESSGLATGKRQHHPQAMSSTDAENASAPNQNPSRSNQMSSSPPRDAASGQATGKRVAAGGDDFAESDAAAGQVRSPRDAASGLATGKRQHMPVSTGDVEGDGGSDAKAQDYNSSRSNKTASARPMDDGDAGSAGGNREAGSGLATGKRQHKPLNAPDPDSDNDGVQDHNSSRSNKTGSK